MPERILVYPYSLFVLQSVLAGGSVPLSTKKDSGILSQLPISLTKHQVSSMKPGAAPGISTLEAFADTSGSGKGAPLLVQMTISRQFSLVKQIGEVCVVDIVYQINF